MKVKFGKLHEDAVLPQYAKEGDAGLDLTATSKEVKYGDLPDVPDNQLAGTERTSRVKYIQYGTGISVEIPEGHVGLLFPRSSVTKRDLMLKNSVGVIDSGYRGEIMLRFKSVKPETDRYEVGERIGQLIIMPIPRIEPRWALELSDSERGEGGFGSTDK